MSNLRRCKICKLYKDVSSIDKNGVCQQCRAGKEDVIQHIRPAIPLFDRK